MKINLLYLFVFITTIINAKISYIPGEFIVLEKANTGYDLYIKKTDGVNSILLTESQKDPSLKITSYGLRTAKFYECNGNEIRILDRRILHTKYDSYFLVDSTTESYGKLGECFHFYLPDEVLYGYEWGRHGVLEIKPGVSINLRLFDKKYADYNGEFVDQWLTLKLSLDESRFNKDIFENIGELTKAGKGKLIVKNDENLSDFFLTSISSDMPVSYDCDLIFIVDCTLSMKEEIPVFKNVFPKIKEAILKKVKNLRLGLIVYRDYGDAFLNRVYDLTDDLVKIDYLVKQIVVDGGADIPEAVNEAVYELKNMNFKSNNRIVFLICDAPAHPAPRGKITREDAIKVIIGENIKFNAFCLPVK